MADETTYQEALDKGRELAKENLAKEAKQQKPVEVEAPAAPQKRPVKK